MHLLFNYIKAVVFYWLNNQIALIMHSANFICYFDTLCNSWINLKQHITIILIFNLCINCCDRKRWPIWRDILLFQQEINLKNYHIDSTTKIKKFFIFGGEVVERVGDSKIVQLFKCVRYFIRKCWLDALQCTKTHSKQTKSFWNIKAYGIIFNTKSRPNLTTFMVPR